MVSKQTDRILEMLFSYGLSDEEARIYLYLVQNPQSTALKISKELHIGRTKVYRILDTLYSRGLTDQTLGSRGYIFDAQPFENLQQLIADKELQVSKLKNDLPLLVSQLESLFQQAHKRQDYKVVYYDGDEGVKRITWNSSKATDPLRIYEVEGMYALPGVDDRFSERFIYELLINGVVTKQLTNLTHFDNFTKHYEYVKKFWSVKYIDPKVTNIQVETLVYNDVVAMYHIEGKDPFCVEIHNEHLAQMQKQIFDFVWVKARKMKVVKPGGAVKLV